MKVIEEMTFVPHKEFAPSQLEALRYCCVVFIYFFFTLDIKTCLEVLFAYVFSSYRFQERWRR